MFRSNWTVRLEIYLVRIISKNDAIFRKCLDTGLPLSVHREDNHGTGLCNSNLISDRRCLFKQR